MEDGLGLICLFADGLLEGMGTGMSSDDCRGTLRSGSDEGGS